MTSGSVRERAVGSSRAVPSPSPPGTTVDDKEEEAAESGTTSPAMAGSAPLPPPPTTTRRRWLGAAIGPMTTLSRRCCRRCTHEPSRSMPPLTGSLDFDFFFEFLFLFWIFFPCGRHKHLDMKTRFSRADALPVCKIRFSHTI